VNRRFPSRRLASAIIAIWMVAGAVLLGTTRPAPPPAYAGGAPPGFSGGFKETSCDACHFDNDLNAKPGQLTITGVPERFAAGERYPLTITLSRPGMRMGGFQFTARMADGGVQAGTLAPAEGEEKRLAIEVSNNVQYANQRQSGTAPVEPGTARWTLLWTAPATPGPIEFHAAANAADNDESARGDYVYTATARSAAPP
jgi:hypothetical protein